VRIYTPTAKMESEGAKSSFKKKKKWKNALRGIARRELSEGGTSTNHLNAKKKLEETALLTSVRSQNETKLVGGTRKPETREQHVS